MRDSCRVKAISVYEQLSSDLYEMVSSARLGNVANLILLKCHIISSLKLNSDSKVVVKGLVTTIPISWKFNWQANIQIL